LDFFWTILEENFDEYVVAAFDSIARGVAATFKTTENISYTIEKYFYFSYTTVFTHPISHIPHF